MFYQGNLYPSARHLLLANPELVAGGDLDLVVAKLNDRARRAKNKGAVLNYTLTELAARYQLEPIRYADEFLAWSEFLLAGAFEHDFGCVFYEVRPIE